MYVMATDTLLLTITKYERILYLIACLGNKGVMQNKSCVEELLFLKRDNLDLVLVKLIDIVLQEEQLLYAYFDSNKRPLSDKNRTKELDLQLAKYKKQEVFLIAKVHELLGELYYKRGIKNSISIHFVIKAISKIEFKIKSILNSKDICSLNKQLMNYRYFLG